MHKIIRKLLGKLNVATALFLAVLMTGVLGMGTYALASSTATSNFTQTINAGALAVDIVNGSYETVGSPTMAMDAATFSFSCQTITGSFGTSTPSVEKIYISNPDAADSGWSLNLAATTITDVWDSAGTDFDFNDPAGSGCTGGQMTVDPTVANLAQGQSGNGVSGVSLGASAVSFSQGVTDTANIAVSDGTTDVGDWVIDGVSISQKIPAEQPAASDYDINMELTIGAV